LPWKLSSNALGYGLSSGFDDNFGFCDDACNGRRIDSALEHALEGMAGEV
jgi:hypothetical protein